VVSEPRHLAEEDPMKVGIDFSCRTTVFLRGSNYGGTGGSPKDHQSGGSPKDRQSARGPGTNAAIVAKISGGSTVNVTSCRGEWCTFLFRERAAMQRASTTIQAAIRQPAHRRMRLRRAMRRHQVPTPILFGVCLSSFGYGSCCGYGTYWGWHRRYL
jgi:hypothetical protein